MQDCCSLVFKPQPSWLLSPCVFPGARRSRGRREAREKGLNTTVVCRSAPGLATVDAEEPTIVAVVVISFWELNKQLDLEIATASSLDARPGCILSFCERSFHARFWVP